MLRFGFLGPLNKGSLELRASTTASQLLSRMVGSLRRQAHDPVPVQESSRSPCWRDPEVGRLSPTWGWGLLHQRASLPWGSG